MGIDLRKFMARFVEEAREHVGKLNHGLLILEGSPGDLETLNGIFRSAHTLKGSSRMMKLAPITEAAHRLEEVLDALRGGRLRLSRELGDLLFRGVDIISELVEQAGSGQPLSADVSLLCRELDMAVANLQEERTGEGEGTGTVLEPSPKPSSVETKEKHGTSASPLEDTTIRINMVKLDQLIKLTGEMVSGHGRLKQQLMEIKALERLSEKCLALTDDLNKGKSSNACAEISRVAQMMSRKLKRVIFSVTDDTNALEQLTRELQRDSLEMRMLPLSSLFDSMRRTVRDLSRSLGKKVELVTEGGETELDKKMIEKIGDPLFHMIRNAIDHGIEAPDDRLRAGKAEMGTLKLSARYEGESVLITLEDDGAGISLARLKERCLQKRIYSGDELDILPESELIHVIFRPGFSTSEIVTDISGRGVGMDVVRRNIVEHLKGSLQVASREGKGTVFCIRLLLTLAIMHVLLVSVSDMIFAVPANAVMEILRILEDDIIGVVDRKAIRLREQIVPLVNLEDVLSLPPGSPAGTKGMLVLVVNVGGKRLGLTVDSVLSEENVVMKTLPPHMQNNRLVSGVTTTAKNEIISVLNISEVAQAAGSVRTEQRRAPAAPPEKKPIQILVVDDSINTREIEKSILEAHGYCVTLAADGMEALEKTAGFTYDVVITDIEMPRLDGFSLTERLRRDDQYKDTPIILVTSRDKDADKKRGIQVGASAYIVKGSFDQSSLLDTVKNFVG